MKRLLAILPLVAIVFAMGCEPGKPGPVPVSGKVLIDGKPAANVIVTFMDAKDITKNATGKTGEDGTYQLTTDKKGDGARPGDYKITFQDGELQEESPQMTSTGTKGPDISNPDYIKQMEKVMNANKDPNAPKEVKEGRIPIKYAGVDTTPYTKKVEPPKGDFDFELEGNKPAK